MTTTEPTVAFTAVRKGYDPGEVDAHIRYLHDQLHDKDVEAGALTTEMQRRLTEAKQREEAVHLMLVAATKTKDEMTDQARKQLEESDSEARTQAEKLVSEARYEAFRLVTEARAEADTVLETAQAESGDKLAKTNEEAQSIISTARRDALGILTTAQGDATMLADASDDEKDKLRAELEAEHVELTARVERLRTVAHELESRLQTLAASALGDLDGLLAESAPTTPDVAPVETPAPEEVPAPLGVEIAESPAEASTPVPSDPAFVGGGMALIEPAMPVKRQPANETPFTDEVPDGQPTAEEEPVHEEPASHEPAPEAVPVAAAETQAEGRSLRDRINEEQTTDTSEKATVGGSFYSRRSANLPRIGEEAGKGALAAVNAMRERLLEADDDESEDRAMQTA